MKNRLSINKVLILITFFSFVMCNLSAQYKKKQIAANFTNEAPKINGAMDDEVWKKAVVASDFIEFEPVNKDIPYNKTQVRLLFDNAALYIIVYMYDNNPDSILKEFSVRDKQNVNADYFSIIISPFNDGLNAYEFKVSASGVQSDVKHSADNEDYNWDAVWESAVQIVDDGWILEMKIPFSAIRFPKKDVQLWGVNFFRSTRRIRELSTWNFIDVEKDGMLTQFGEITGVENVSPPVRLSFTPYVSGYIDNESTSSEIGYNFNGGMDLKYGINESFTLDMTMVPDFGQVQSDDEILNLSPFEVQYDEKRQFFTEGTELFSKCDIFYSRRIGSEPENYGLIEDDTTIMRIRSNPEKTKLINATKISGRTKGGLGIGLFNAMTAPSYAEVVNFDGNGDKIITQEFTNYNLIVLDQNLWKNSYVSLINTNVNKTDYSANVTGTEFLLSDKKNDYVVSGNYTISQKYYKKNDDVFGHKYEIGAGKVSGNFQYYVENYVATDKFDPNDMGYLDINNDITTELEISHHIYKPFWKLLNMHNELNIEHYALYEPTVYSSFSLDYSSFFTFKNYLTVSVFGGGSPIDHIDYFEPRVEGKKFNQGRVSYAGLYFSSDYRKTLAIDLRIALNQSSQISNTAGIEMMLRPRIRISDRMLLIPVSSYSKLENNIGYANHTGNDVLMGIRDVTMFTNTIQTSYIFSPYMSIDFRLRHYWSKVNYKNKVFDLLHNGNLSEQYELNTDNYDINFNAFTIDMGFKWYFAPGSEMNIVWKNAIYSSQNEIIRSFTNNLNHIFDSPQVNSFSLRVLYYLDYQYLKKRVN